jgi:hypothetical protein
MKGRRCFRRMFHLQIGQQELFRLFLILPILIAPGADTIGMRVFILFVYLISYVKLWNALRYTAMVTPSASPELTCLPVFLIFSSTVSYETESSVVTSAVCVSSETLNSLTPVKES